jgi:hypothetical protein
LFALLALLVIGCEGDGRFQFEPTRQSVTAISHLCEPAASAPVPASTLFANEAMLCISDTDFNTMTVADVVTRQPQSRPSAATRAALAMQGSIDRYGTVVWGLDAEGDVTFLTTEEYLFIGQERLYVAAGFSGCVPIHSLRIDVQPTEYADCTLRLETTGEQR